MYLIALSVRSTLRKIITCAHIFSEDIAQSKVQIFCM